MEWLYAGLCGIRQAPGSVGFKQIEIRPQPVGDIRQAKASYRSVHGVIMVEWKKDRTVFELNLAIPPNTTDTVYFPEGYKKGPVKIGSGAYRFSINGPSNK